VIIFRATSFAPDKKSRHALEVGTTTTTCRDDVVVVAWHSSQERVAEWVLNNGFVWRENLQNSLATPWRPSADGTLLPRRDDVRLSLVR
jgi:hypothetical protein